MTFLGSVRWVGFGSTSAEVRKNGNLCCKMQKEQADFYIKISYFLAASTLGYGTREMVHTNNYKDFERLAKSLAKIVTETQLI